MLDGSIKYMLYYNCNTEVLCWGVWMESAVVAVRVPAGLKSEAERLVKAGYFRSLSEVIVSGLRREVIECGPSKATLLLRKQNERMWAEYMRKANGDYDRAVGLYLGDLDRLAEKHGFKD